MPNGIYSVKEVAEMVNEQIQQYLNSYPTDKPISYMLNNTVAHTDNVKSPVPNQDYIVSNASGKTELVHKDTIQPNQIEDKYSGLFDINKAYKNQFTSALILTGATEFFRKRVGDSQSEDLLGDGSSTYTSLYSRVYGDIAKAGARALNIPYTENIAETMQNLWPSGVEYVTNLIRADIPLKVDISGKNAEKSLRFLSHSTSFLSKDVGKVGYNTILDTDVWTSAHGRNGLTKYGIIFPFLFMYTGLLSRESYTEIGIYDKKRVENNDWNRMATGLLPKGGNISSYGKTKSLIPSKLNTILRILENMIRRDQINPSITRKQWSGDIQGAYVISSNSNMKNRGVNYETLSNISVQRHRIDWKEFARKLQSTPKYQAEYKKLNVFVISSSSFYQDNFYNLTPNIVSQDPNMFDFHFTTLGRKIVVYNELVNNVEVDLTNLYFKATLENINENYESNWQTKESFGRMDKMAMYVNTARNIGLSFKLAAETPQEQVLNLMRLDWLAKHSYATYYNKQQTFGFYKYPFVKMTIGGLYKDLPGYFSGLKVDVEKVSYWDDGKPITLGEGTITIPATPQIMTITLTFNVVYDKFVDGDYQFYDIAEDRDNLLVANKLTKESLVALKADIEDFQVSYELQPANALPSVLEGPTDINDDLIDFNNTLG